VGGRGGVEGFSGRGSQGAEGCSGIMRSYGQPSFPYGYELFIKLLREIVQSRMLWDIFGAYLLLPCICSSNVGNDSERVNFFF
jgi:hypothetical protein